tara:strand:+ start:307 stop:435 length:129 start_codon:yes stop_codon:yes gene_type:complete
MFGNFWMGKSEWNYLVAVILIVLAGWRYWWLDGKLIYMPIIF